MNTYYVFRYPDMNKNFIVPATHPRLENYMQYADKTHELTGTIESHYPDTDAPLYPGTYHFIITGQCLLIATAQPFNLCFTH